MKIKPVILCGGAGTRLWSKSISKVPKQFVDFGGWSLFQKTLFRINNKIFDYFKDIWKKRNDRYSELRHSKKINKVNKIEMSYIGG